MAPKEEDSKNGEEEFDRQRTEEDGSEWERTKSPNNGNGERKQTLEDTGYFRHLSTMNQKEQQEMPKDNELLDKVDEF